MGIVKTGIKGLDSMLFGGIPEGNQVLVAGGPGAGKTLLSFEYLYRNAKEGNVSVFFALEEDPKIVLRNAKTAFSKLTDIDSLVDSKKLIIYGEDLSSSIHSGTEQPTYEFGKFVADMESIITELGATRAVIDSVSLLNILIENPVDYRRSIISLITNFRRIGVTALVTAEMTNPDRGTLTFQPEFFMFDGILTMYQVGEENKRDFEIEVIKMRGSDHSKVTTPYEITPDGFRIFSAEDTANY